MGHSKKILEHLLLNNKNVPSHYPLLKVIYKEILI